MLQIKMTKEMIIEEMNMVTNEQRAVDYAVGRMDFDGMIKELDDLQKNYDRFVKQTKKENAKANPKEIAERLISVDYNFSLSVHDVKSKYYEEAFNFDSEVMCDFEQWSQGDFDEIEDKYEVMDVAEYLKNL